LSPLLLSENLLDQIRANPILEVIGDARDIEFGKDGNLMEMLQAGEPVSH
jgi:hypothetical protein